METKNREAVSIISRKLRKQLIGNMVVSLGELTEEF